MPSSITLKYLLQEPQVLKTSQSLNAINILKKKKKEKRNYMKPGFVEGSLPPAACGTPHTCASKYESQDKCDWSV